MIEQVDVSVPAEYISEVIPIKYAHGRRHCQRAEQPGRQRRKHGQLWQFGGRADHQRHGDRTGGTAAGTGTGGTASIRRQQPARGRFGSQATPGGTPTGGTTFQQRLQSIIQRASAAGQQDQIQVFGQTKIIADQRSNSLLIFATRRTWKGSRPSWQNWTCCSRRCSSSRSSWTFDLANTLELRRFGGAKSEDFQSSPPIHRRRRHEQRPVVLSIS